MYIKIHKVAPEDYGKGNKGSCADLVQYLDKENEKVEFFDREYFFNHNDECILNSKAVLSIDNNVKGLKKDDAKFFMITINPHEKELKHIARKVTNGRTISNIHDLSKDELKRYNAYLRKYTIDVMEQYAKGFNRDILKEDLIYYAKIEQHRYYNRFEALSSNGKIKDGQVKEGLNTHVHVIVSRKDKEMKMSLSPHSNSRGKSKKHQLNGKNVQQGFDRKEFKENCENQFDKRFSYNREMEERFAYMNGVKKGILSGSKNVSLTILKQFDESAKKQIGFKPGKTAYKLMKFTKNPAGSAIKEAIKLPVKVITKGME